MKREGGAQPRRGHSGPYPADKNLKVERTEKKEGRKLREAEAIGGREVGRRREKRRRRTKRLP